MRPGINVDQQPELTTEQPIQPSPQPDFSQVGLPAPAPNLPTFTDEPVAHITNWQNFLLNTKESAIDSTTVNLYRGVRNFINQHESSPVVTNDELKSLKVGREGITFPDNVRQETAKALVSDFDAKQLREGLIEQREPGLLGAASGGLGQVLGSVIADPVATAAAIYAPELLGLERTATGASLAARIGARTLRGGVEGAGFGITQESAKTLNDVSNGEGFHAVQAAYDIGQNVFGGALLHNVGGFIADPFTKEKSLLENQSFVPNDSADDSTVTAANMMVNGKDPQNSMPLKRGLVKTVQQLHDDMRAQNVTPENMLDALDTAKENIDQQVEDNKNAGTDLRDTIGDKTPTEEQQQQLDDIEAKRLDLDQRSKAEEVYRFMTNNPDFSTDEKDVSDFIKTNQDSRTDFANGRGQESLDVVGAPITNESEHLANQYPEDYKKELRDQTDFTSAEQTDLDDINNRDSRTKALRKGIDNVIKCLSGGAGV